MVNIAGSNHCFPAGLRYARTSSTASPSCPFTTQRKNHADKNGPVRPHGLDDPAGCGELLHSGGRADAWKAIKDKRFVDLTHAFAPGIPHWKGFPDERRETVYGYEPGEGTLGSGFYAQTFTHVGQWGTHVDPPAHFVKGLRTVDQIDVKEMILPLVVLDVHEAATKTLTTP